MTNDTLTAYQKYWRGSLGIDWFKAKYLAKKVLHKYFGIMLPQLKDQRDFWRKRGRIYMDEFLSQGIAEREIFFQNILVEEICRLEFDSCFEAGCGFGWNATRMKKEFPGVVSGGIDLSFTQLSNVAVYSNNSDLPIVNADARKIPFKDDSFDVGYTLGVFMSIHPDNIGSAIDEMIRVCGKYVVHLEYDASHTTPEVLANRACKTHIFPHDYRSLYEERGKRVTRFLSHEDFGEAHDQFMGHVAANYERWEKWEGAGRYVLAVVEL
jgi:ubiquinone/menaquinone biosynthesis C-methylase UbiE